MMRIRFYRVAWPFLTLVAAAAHGATISWTNVNGGFWSTPANWNAHVVPGPSDSVNITAAGTYTVTADTGVTIQALTLGGASGQQTLTNNAQTIVTGNFLLGANGIFGLGGGTLNGGPLTDQGLFLLGGGTVSMPVSVTPAGTLNVSGTTATVQAPLTNAGTTYWSGNGAYLYLYNNHTTYTGAIYNQPGALFVIQNDLSLSGGYGFELFQNAGTVRKLAGTGTTTFSVAFTNAGTVDAQSGTLQFNGGGNIGATYNTSSNGTVQFASGNYVETGTVTNTGSGIFRLNGANVTLNDRITRFILASGNVALSPTFQVSGAIQNLQMDGAYLTGTNRVTGTLGFNGGGLAVASPLTVTASGTLNFNGAAVYLYSPLTNAGAVYWSGSTISPANNGSTYTGAIYNQPGGLFILQSDQSLSSAGYGFEAFNNAGIVRKTAGLGSSLFNLPFTSTGTVDAQSGTIRFGSGGSVGGTYNTAAGAVVEFGGGSFVQTGTPSVTGAGVCRLNGANLTLQDRIANFVLAAGNVALTPTFQTNGPIYNLQLDGAYLTGTNKVSGMLGFNGGGTASASPLTVLPGGTLNFNGATVNLYSQLTNSGTINWSGSTVSLANNGTTYTGAIYNQTGAVFNLVSDQSLVSAGYGQELFNNGGTVRKTAGLGISTFSLPFTNSGTVDAQSGTIRFNSGGNIGGNYNTTSAGLIEFSGGNYNQTGTPNLTGPGICRQNGANVTLSDRIAGFLLISGNVALTPGFQGSGAIQNLQLDGAYLTGANRVTGTLGFNGGGTASASPLTVAPGGVLNFNGASVNLYAPLTNNGTINWSGTTVSVANNAALYTGAIYNQPGAVFNLQSDQSLASAGYGFELLNNAGTIRKTAGLGASTFSLTFANTGTLDAQSGTIRIAGPYTQTGGAMNFGITSLSYFGQINFTAAAPLTGTLSVNFNGNYFPSAGDSFALVTYGSRSGLFTSLALPAQAQWQTNYSATTFTLSVLSVVGGGVPVTLKPVALSAGHFTLEINGPLGPTYVVQASSNLVNWVSFLTNTPSVVPFPVVDTNAGNFTHRFYRAFFGQ